MNLQNNIIENDTQLFKKIVNTILPIKDMKYYLSEHDFNEDFEYKRYHQKLHDFIDACDSLQIIFSNADLEAKKNVLKVKIEDVLQCANNCIYRKDGKDYGLEKSWRDHQDRSDEYNACRTELNNKTTEAWDAYSDLAILAQNILLTSIDL